MIQSDPTMGLRAHISTSPTLPAKAVLDRLQVSRQRLHGLRQTFTAVTGVAIPQEKTGYVHSRNLIAIFEAALTRPEPLELALRNVLEEQGFTLPPVINATQSSSAEVDALTARVAALEGTVAQLMAWQEHVNENLPKRAVLEPFLDGLDMLLQQQGIDLAPVHAMDPLQN